MDLVLPHEEGSGIACMWYSAQGVPLFFLPFFFLFFFLSQVEWRGKIRQHTPFWAHHAWIKPGPEYRNLDACTPTKPHFLLG